MWNKENKQDFLVGEKIKFISVLSGITYFLVFLCSFIIPFTNDSISFQILLFYFLLLFIIDPYHTFWWLLMMTIQGVCGHIKASWDNHSNCLSCSSCSRLSTCLVCNTWTSAVWDLLCLLIEEARSWRSLNIHIRKEDVFLPHLLLLNLLKTMVDTKRGWSDGVKVSYILRHWGVQLILAYSWARSLLSL